MCVPLGWVDFSVLDKLFLEKVSVLILATTGDKELDAPLKVPDFGQFGGGEIAFFSQI